MGGPTTGRAARAAAETQKRRPENRRHQTFEQVARVGRWRGLRCLMRASVALALLALTPVLFWRFVSGPITFGGGEEDALWISPWLLWSTAFAVTMVAGRLRGWPAKRSIAVSALASVVVLVVAAALLAGLGSLGIAGR
jgi:hypothetical protein